MRSAGFARDAEFVGMRALMPSSLVLLLSGIAMIVNLDWDWEEPFVSVGLVIWPISFAAGAGFLGPESGRIARIIDAEGLASP